MVFTGDLGGQVVRLQNQQRQMAPTAAQWAHDQAAEELAKVEKIHGELEQAGHKLPDGAELLQEGPRRACRRAPTCGSDGKHEEAYEKSQAALRSVRILMRADWDQAVKPLTTPTASPFAVSYYTLPKHWQFIEQIQRPANLAPTCCPTAISSRRRIACRRAG